MDYLKELKPDDIELLISDIKLQKDGYIFNYIIDSYDVFNYTFPYGISNQNISNKSLEDIGDDFIAYNYIFSNYSPIILDEYKFELISNRNSVIENAKEFYRKDLLQNVINLYGKENLVNHDIINSASFLLATVFMTKSLIDNFDDIFYSKLQIESLSVMNTKDKLLIETYFKNISRTEWSKNMFEKWVENQNEINSENIEHSKQHFKSSLIDYIVIDRVCNINSIVEKSKELQNKYIFIYFSGANKTKFFFNDDDVKAHLPKIANKNHYNILRTPKHTFLLSLLHDKDLNVVLSSLKVLLKLSRKYQLNKKLFAKIYTSHYYHFSEEESKMLEEIDRKRRNMLEFGIIAKKIKAHTDIQSKIKDKIKLIRKSKDLKELVELYSNFLELASSSLSQFNKIQYQSTLLVQSKLLNLIEILSKKGDFTIPEGYDLIKGSYHHFPILLFLNKDEHFSIPSYKIIFNEIVDFIIKPSILRQLKLTEFINKIKSIYFRIESDNFDKDNFQSILLKSLILCLIEQNDNIANKKEIFYLLEDTYKIISNSNNNIKEKYESEYLYLLEWASRRLKLFDKTVEYSKIAVNKYPQDPRFHHGKCLLLYNYCFSSSLKSCDLKKIIELVDITENSINLYDKYIHSNKSQSIYIKGNISALNNLLLYSLSVYYYNILLEKGNLKSKFIKKYTLDYLRENTLKLIKDFEQESGNPNKGFPEYCHTEAVFELVEGLFKNDINKLLSAKKEIKHALELNPNSALYIHTKHIIYKFIYKFKNSV